MWCSSCQAEVAAKVSTDNSRLFCASCGMELKFSTTNQKPEKTRQAQDLLERWSHQIGEEKITSEINEIKMEKTVPDDNLKVTGPEEKTEPERNSGQDDQQLENPLSQHIAEVSHHASEERNESNHVVPFPAESQTLNPPNRPQIDVQSTITRDKPHNTNWIGFFGQLLAYGGVGLLTVGTCMILMGYFGGKEGYAPQGWLISTIGQMALLLGIVTLVSSGIEHSSNEVTNHIASLDERILRIEQAALARYSSQEENTHATQQQDSYVEIPAKAS